MSSSFSTGKRQISPNTKLPMLWFMIPILYLSACQQVAVEESAPAFVLNAGIGDTLSLKTEFSDLTAQITDEKASNFQGYRCIITSYFVVDSSSDQGSEISGRLFISGFKIDSLASYSIESWQPAALEKAVVAYFPPEGRTYRFSLSDYDLLMEPVAEAVSAFQSLITSRKPIFNRDTRFVKWQDMLEDVRNAPVENPPGTKWQSEREITYNRDYPPLVLNSEWEVLRENSNSKTVFGKGNGKSLRYTDSEEGPRISAENRDQYTVTLVLDKKNNWPIRGLLDFKEEGSIYQHRSRMKDGADEAEKLEKFEVRVPVRASRVKIRFLDE
jgi:hypothetical protein